MICHRCGSEYMIRHGRRSTERGSVQIYLCKECNHTSSNTPLPYLNADPQTVLKGVSLYNQGFSLQQVSKMLKHVTGENVPRNTIHHWIHRYEDVFTYAQVRERTGVRNQVVSKRYPTFSFRFHKRKVGRIMDDVPGLSRYLASIIRGLPKKYLEGEALADRWIGKRRELKSIFMTRKEFGSAECTIADILRSTSEKHRGEVARALLINDSFTICTHAPLYAITKELGRRVRSGLVPMVQVRKDRIWLLAYSPEGEDQMEVLAGLLGCAEAASSRCRLGLDRIRIGAFDRERLWLLEPQVAFHPKKVIPRRKLISRSKSKAG